MEARGKASWHQGLPVVKTIYTIYTYGFQWTIVQLYQKQENNPLLYDAFNLIKKFNEKTSLFPVYSSTEIICKFMGINRDEKGVLKIKATFFSKDNK